MELMCLCCNDWQLGSDNGKRGALWLPTAFVEPVFLILFLSLFVCQDGFGVTFNCLDDKPADVTVCTFDGQNWEQTYAASDISKLSKEQS